jgi:hypothetical protein
MNEAQHLGVNMNPFQLNYETRLSSWHALKAEVAPAELQVKCQSIDNWWQRAPLVAHYLHTHDIQSWPGPWELLVENTYCEVARALGMCYTLYMTGTQDFELVEATDNMGNDVVLVLVDRAKYILNYWPDTVLNNCLQDFSIKKQIDLAVLVQKL